jgi:hypothetical protein
VHRPRPPERRAINPDLLATRLERQAFNHAANAVIDGAIGARNS